MNRPFQVIITDLIDDDCGPERAVLEDIASVTAMHAHGEAELIGRVEQADAIILYHELSLSQVTLARLKQCRVIVRGGVGFDNVDRLYARERGIAVANVPDYGTEEVADSALGLMLALTRGIHVANSQLRAGAADWSYLVAAPLVRLRGQTLGIVGLGRIGTAMAQRGKVLGMDVLFFDPYKPDGYDKALGIRRAETLAQLLQQAFVVSLHCPLSEETHHLIDVEAIQRMRRGSYLINTSRGAVVDRRPIPDALAAGQLAGVGIDVLEQEPPRVDDPLLVAWRDVRHAAHHKLILNPHIAWYCADGQLELRRKTAETCRGALLGQPLRNVVN